MTMSLDKLLILGMTSPVGQVVICVLIPEVLNQREPQIG